LGHHLFGDVTNYKNYHSLLVEKLEVNSLYETYGKAIC